MSKTYEYYQQLEEELKNDWTQENFPEALKNTPDWEVAEFSYDTFHEWEYEERLAQFDFETTLESVPER